MSWLQLSSVKSIFSSKKSAPKTLEPASSFSRNKRKAMARMLRLKIHGRPEGKFNVTTRRDGIVTERMTELFNESLAKLEGTLAHPPKEISPPYIQRVLLQANLAWDIYATACNSASAGFYPRDPLPKQLDDSLATLKTLVNRPQVERDWANKFHHLEKEIEGFKKINAPVAGSLQYT